MVLKSCSASSTCAPAAACHQADDGSEVAPPASDGEIDEVLHARATFSDRFALLPIDSPTVTSSSILVPAWVRWQMV
jgi:hypothetical protein